MQKPKNPAGKRAWTAIYCLCVMALLCMVAGFYKSPYGFTRLAGFGDANNHKSLAGIECYIYPGSAGADGQYYATIALDPLLKNRSLGDEVGSVFYRGRRILFSWTAWLLGCSRPNWILQVFSLQNTACWLGLAWLLVRWFPPDDFNNFLRWAGVLFSCGMLYSVRTSHLDGPTLLLIALAMKYIEEDKPRRANIALALAGLARENSLMAMIALANPAKRSFRDLWKLALRVVWIVAPLALWIIYLWVNVPIVQGSSGFNDFTFPFVEMFHWFGRLVSEIAGGKLGYWKPFLVLIGLITQAVFLLIKADWKSPWWRLGIAYAVLMVCMSGEIWEHGAGDATRVLLPMLLAFNVLAPRGRRWLPLLVAGNLSVIYVPILLLPPH